MSIQHTDEKPAELFLIAWTDVLGARRMAVCSSVKDRETIRTVDSDFEMVPHDDRLGANMSAGIVLKWDTAEWEEGVGSELVAIMLDALEEVGRVLPDSVSTYRGGGCNQCEGSGVLGHYSHVDPATGEHLGDQDIPCPTCQGTGLKP